MPWFPSNLKVYGYIGAVLAVFSAGLYVRGQWDENRLESKLRAQQEALVKQCDDNQKNLEETNNGLQTKISAISKRLIASKRLPAVCVKVVSGVADHSSSGGEHAGSHGLSSIWLNEYAAECEQYRTEVITLDEYGKKNCQ